MEEYIMGDYYSDLPGMYADLEQEMREAGWFPSPYARRAFWMEAEEAEQEALEREYADWLWEQEMDARTFGDGGAA